MIEPIFVIPVIAGVATMAFSFVFFKRDTISPKYFAITVLLSISLVFSPVLYYFFTIVKLLFGIEFTFVIVFGTINVVVLVLLVYILLSIGRIQDEISSLWQEAAIIDNKLDGSQRND